MNNNTLANYNKTLHSIHANPDKATKIIKSSQLPPQYKRRLQKSTTAKLDIVLEKKEALDNFLYQENWQNLLSQELKIDEKSISSYQTHNHILILKITKENIEKSFFSTQKLDNIENIWFLVKEHNLWFDIIIASDESIIEHEINESITDLFLASNQKKISIFQLDKVSPNEYKNLDRAILQDILSHLFSTDKAELENEILVYISHTQNAISQYPQFETPLFQVKKYLTHLYSAMEEVYDFLLLFISNPYRLYKLQPHLVNQNLEIDSDISENLYSILSNCKIDTRFCTITRRVVNKTYSESSSFTHNSSFVEEISTCLNIDKDNNNYKLKYYFKKMIELGKINEIIWKISKWNTIIIIWNNWIELKMKINNSGNISFLVEHIHIKETTTTTTYDWWVEERIEDRKWDIRKLPDRILSGNAISSSDKTVIIETKKNTASLKSIQKWVEHIINMKINEEIKKDIIISKSIENTVSKSKEIIKTPFHIENPDVHYLLSLYLKDLLDKWEVEQIVGNIWGEMRLLRKWGNIDELVISEDWYIGFNIVKTTRKEFEKTTTDTYDVKHTNYNIGSEKFVDKNVVDFDQDISFQLLEENSELDEEGLENKDNLVDTMNNIYALERKKSEDKGKNIVGNIQERVSKIREKNISQWMEKFRNSSRKKLDQISKKVEFSNKHQHITSLYQSSIKYAVEQINWYIEEDLDIEISEENKETNPYLFQYKWHESDILLNRGKYIELITFFERKSDIDEELDRLQVKIRINKETDEIEIINDWHRDGCNMCSSHQMFDNIFDDSLEQLWLSPARNDQKEKEFITTSYENILEQTQRKLAYSLHS